MHYSEPLPRLVALSRKQRNFSDRPVYRVKSRNGKRQIFFLPTVVVKFARGRVHQDLVQKENVANGKACAHPFWRDLATPAFSLGRVGMIRRRYRSVTLEDFGAIAALIDARLEAALAYPQQPMLKGLKGRSLFAQISDQARDGLRTRLHGWVPATSMHGDLHFFNFVAKGASYRLLDWEHFEADGSFAHDYLDFHISVTCINSGKRWAEVLRTVDAEHPAVQKLAARLGADPAALLAYFLFIKVDTIFARQGGADFTRQPEAAVLRATVENAIARLEPPSATSASA